MCLTALIIKLKCVFNFIFVILDQFIKMALRFNLVSYEQRGNQFVDFKKSPRTIVTGLTKVKRKLANPLYSQESLDKYYKMKKLPAPKKLTHQFCAPKKTPQQLKQSISKFDQLQAHLRKTMNQYNHKKLKRMLNNFEGVIEKQQTHFKNLNLEDGIVPLQQFTRDNFLITNYLQDLKAPPKVRIITEKQKRELAHKRAHTENIIDYLSKSITESRYMINNSIQRIEQKLLQNSWERTNKSLRSKTSYCRKKYYSPQIHRQLLDSQILKEGKVYMKKNVQDQHSRYVL